MKVIKMLIHFAYFHIFMIRLEDSLLRPYMDAHDLQGIQLQILNWFRLWPYIRIFLGELTLISDGIR